MYANDRADLALLAGCDGVHVGQEDLPIALVRALAAGRALRVGNSTHDEAQVDAAIFEAPDYIAIGPIFPTKSKDKPSPVVGIDRLAALVARVRERRPDVPIVAIGGITRNNAAKVGAIVDAAAVIQALLPDSDGPSKWGEVTARAEAIGAAIRGEESAS